MILVRITLSLLWFAAYIFLGWPAVFFLPLFLYFSYPFEIPLYLALALSLTSLGLDMKLATLALGAALVYGRVMLMGTRHA